MFIVYLQRVADGSNFRHNPSNGITVGIKFHANFTQSIKDRAGRGVRSSARALRKQLR